MGDLVYVVIVSGYLLWSFLISCEDGLIVFVVRCGYYLFGDVVCLIYLCCIDGEVYGEFFVGVEGFGS